MNTEHTYVSPKIKRIKPDGVDSQILASLTTADAITVDALVDETGLNKGSIGGRLAVLVDNGYVDREKIDKVFYYSKLQHKRQYNPQRRWSAAKKLQVKNGLPEVKDVTPIQRIASGGNKFDEVIRALNKATIIDEVKTKIRLRLTNIETQVSEIDDLLASL